MHDGAFDNSQLLDELRRLLESMDASGRALLPATNSELLQTVVEAAARIFGAAAASISLIDEADNTLVFKVAYGAGRDQVLGMRIPLDHGIAGYVASTAQPIAISNVGQDARFNQEFAESTGYVPSSILATPLMIGGRVIGVMEVLDKISAPSFGMQDMELLGVFARQAAIAIQQSQQMGSLSLVFVEALGQIIRTGGSEQPTTLEALASEIEEAQPGYQETMVLASLFFDIAQAGEAEKRLGVQMLSAVRDYLRSRPSFHR